MAEAALYSARVARGAGRTVRSTKVRRGTQRGVPWLLVVLLLAMGGAVVAARELRLTARDDVRSVEPTLTQVTPKPAVIPTRVATVAPSPALAAPSLATVATPRPTALSASTGGGAVALTFD